MNEVEILRGRVAENSSLQAHIVGLNQSLILERALADDLAAVLAKIHFPGIWWQDEQEAALERYRQART